MDSADPVLTAIIDTAAAEMKAKGKKMANNGMKWLKANYDNLQVRIPKMR